MVSAELHLGREARPGRRRDTLRKHFADGLRPLWSVASVQADATAIDGQRASNPIKAPMFCYVFRMKPSRELRECRRFCDFRRAAIWTQRHCYRSFGTGFPEL